MRINRLDLLAFGPFTDRILEFNSDMPGLHVIFGPNEAGKSSSLRALKALLYGFPERTPDNFRHANDQLLVGGRIQDDNGRKLTFLRRKKRKADLLNPDGSPLDPGILTAFLHGIDPALFESLYGIDHKTLVDGGEDILGQKGEVGQALFAAGAGISSLKKILDALDADADALFKARGSTPKINKALKEYNELKKIVKEASLPSAKWKEHRKRKKTAEEELARLEKESAQKSAEVQRLDRLCRAIPELAKLKNLKKQMQALGKVVVLPPKFADQVRQVEQELREIKLQLDKDRERLGKLRARKEEIPLNKAILDQAEAVEDLYQRLGEYRKGNKDLSKLEGMRVAHRRDAATLLKSVRQDLTPENAESLRPVLTRKRTIQELSSRHEALVQHTAQVRKRQEDAKQALKEIAEVLSRIPAIRKSGDLETAVKQARKAGDLDAQIEKIIREIRLGKKDCRAALTRFGLWTGGLDHLPALALPLAETIRRFDQQFRELENDKKQLEAQRKEAEKNLKESSAESRKMAYMGEVPSEQDLKAARKKRQEGWLLLRRLWIGGEDISKPAAKYAPDRPLHEAYEKEVEQADHIADRLRREAERVARAASLSAGIESLNEKIREIRCQEKELNTREERLAAEWNALWAPLNIRPLPPREMRDWLTDIDALRIKVTGILNMEHDAEEKDKMRQHHRRTLINVLKSLGEEESFSGKALSPVLVFAEAVLETIVGNRAELEKYTEKQTQCLRALDKAVKDLEDAETARNEWEISWNKALSGLGLSRQVLPGEALDLLETIGTCFEKLEKAGEFQSRINGISRDETQFGKDVSILLEQAAPDLKNLPLDQAVLNLHTMLGKARQDSALLNETSEKADLLTAEINHAKKTLSSLDARMADLLAIAGCDKKDDLVEAIEKSGECRRLQEKISDAEATLAKMSGGIPITEIQQQADKVSVDALPGQIASLTRQIDAELYPGIKEISKIIGEENKELKLMDGSARAAEAAEKMAQVAAGIQRRVDQYTRIKVAAMVLKDEIERYREKHQDPVLRVASGYFSELTIGSFSGLRTDVDDKGTPVLVGVRPDDTRLSVDKMSDGTRDQLYLALRLATLESRLENSEPMPFIVDDILINFDDDRTRATLGVLAKLAEKNQVILFTHHRQVVNASRKISAKGVVHVHELDPD